MSPLEQLPEAARGGGAEEGGGGQADLGPSSTAQARPHQRRPAGAA